MHLESALRAAVTRLERGGYSAAALVSLRVLAWRYESLAAMPSRSGTHPVVDEIDEGDEPEGEPSLRGKRILVADDDAEVRWFYVGILREAGAHVAEARDGFEALELARDEEPDVILADIVMPRLDGLELCAAVRREPALDGVPVVLLSWRDDFLHRVRELRAGAQGYLRKELPARQILLRISSVLEPLRRLETSLRDEHESRGDLEELGVSRLLRTVRRLRPDASIVVQDPWSLFELEMRSGHMVGLTRTAIDGAITQGAAALPALVGMGSGRFVVVPREPTGVTEADDAVSLDEEFDEASVHLGAIMNVLADDPDCLVELDEDVLGAYARHSPAGVQRLIARLANGETPRALWRSGAGTRSLVDALLATLARQGAIRDVVRSSEAPEAPPEVGSSQELEPGSDRPPEPAALDPTERENLRAQSALAMYREPANRGPRSEHPIWRLRAGGAPKDVALSRFIAQARTKPRLLGLAFIVLLAATAALLVWRAASPPSADAPLSASPPPANAPTVAAAPAPSPAAEQTAEPAGSPEAESARRPSAAAAPWSGLTGTLREGVQPSLEVSDMQGVLEVTGAADVRIEVDGEPRGVLPAALVLDEGRHAVRFESHMRSTTRFYYVRAGDTRVVRVVTRPGGFVDAR